MNLDFLNELKKDKERKRLQNKRYREKNRELLNLKKQLSYHKKTFEEKFENMNSSPSKLINEAPQKTY